MTENILIKWILCLKNKLFIKNIRITNMVQFYAEIEIVYSCADGGLTLISANIFWTVFNIFVIFSTRNGYIVGVKGSPVKATPEQWRATTG